MNPFANPAAGTAPLFGPSSVDSGDLQAAARGRKIVYFLGVLALSAVVGLAVVYVKVPLVVGGIVGLLFTLALIRWPYIGLLLYMLIFILRIGELYPALAPLRMERLLGAMTFTSLLLAQIARQRQIAFDRSRLTRTFLWVILAAALSIPLAYWRAGAIEGTMDFLKLLVLYLMIVHLVTTRRRLRIFVYLYAALIAYLAVYAVSDYLRGAILVAQGIDRAIGATSAAGGPNELGATMACTIPLFLLFFQYQRHGAWRVVFLIGLVLMGICMVMTGSRSGLLGFMGGLGYLWWGSRHKAAFAVLGVILLGAAFVALPEQYKGRYSTMTQSELDGSSQERLKVWRKGAAMVASRPLTGVGINCFGTANAMGFSTGRASWLESHSLYVQVPAEMGLIGAFAFFAFLFELVRVHRRTARSMAEDDDDWEFEQRLLKAMLTGVVVLVCTGVFGHSLMRPTWYIYAAIAVATLRVYLGQRRDLSPRQVGELTGNRLPAESHR